MEVTLDGYRKIQEYKKLGLSKAKTAEKMKISRFAVAGCGRKRRLGKLYCTGKTV